jgi:hypothetical protein
VLRNVTITLDAEVLRWARKKAAEEDTSVSKLVGQMLEREMRRTDQYWAAWEKMKRLAPLPGVARNRLSRQEANERRR